MEAGFAEGGPVEETTRVRLSSLYIGSFMCCGYLPLF